MTGLVHMTCHMRCVIVTGWR